MEGLIGLKKSINTTESSLRDLSILERMDARIQQDKQAEVTAQQQEGLMYERAYQMADGLLEKDRKAINKKIAMFQGQVTSHMRDAGGSRKGFMEQGGLSVMTSITNDIMRSDEAVRYQENKKNLAKIWEAQEKGLGHLLSPRDLQSLEDYESNENGGEISYSGMMAEIELPPSANFDYGSEIPLHNIISHKSNMMRLIANYKMNYPEKGEPNYADIYAFAKKMGYGGTGNNTVMLRQKTAQAVIDARSAKAKQTKINKQKNSFIGQFNMFKTQLPQGLNMTDLADKDKYPEGMIEYMKTINPSTSKLLSRKSTLVSRKHGLDEKGLDFTDILGNTSANIIEYMFNEKYGLKESYEFMPLSKHQIVDRILGKEGGAGYEIADGKILNFLPSQGDYRMDGVVLDESNDLDPDAYRGDYKIEGVFTALEGSVQGKSTLIMDTFDDDGVTIDEDNTNKIHEAYKGMNGGSQLAFTTVIALRDENDNLFYHKVDMEKPDVKTALSNMIGDDDDISETVNQENRDMAYMQGIKRMQKEEEITLRSSINELEKSSFNAPLFEQEGEKYYGSHSAGQQNRYPMMKSFYMAFDYINNSNKRTDEFPQGDPNVYATQIDQAVEMNLFTTSALHGGIESALKNYDQGNNPQAIIGQWLNKINESTDSSLGKSNNQAIAQKWSQMLSLMEKN